MGFAIVFLILIIALVYFAFRSAKKSKQTKAEMNSRGVLSYFTALHVEGLGIGNNTLCNILHFDDRVQIESKNSKFQIPLTNLRAAEVKTETELIEKNKTVVGRAIIGTLLVPGLGTIVGGMSGIGSKKKKGNTNTYLIFNYINSRGELDAVTFKNNFSIVKIRSFCKAINQSLGLQSENEVVQL